MSKKTTLSMYVVMSVFLLAITCTAAGKIIYVDADATGRNDGSSWCDAYIYLQDALADANSLPKPVEIWVAAGTYKPDDDRTPEDLVTGSYTCGIALDVAGGKMYWTDWRTDKIRRANLDGSAVEDLVGGLASPTGIALDVAGGKMYWTDRGTDKIQRADLDGSNVQDLVIGRPFDPNDPNDPEGIALDVLAGKMYWTDWGIHKIQRANLDGTGVENLVTGLGNPCGIALDVDGGKMYWTDKSTDRIERANLDGSAVENLVTGLYDPYGIALDLASRKIYWTEEGSSKIKRANMSSGSYGETLVTTDLTTPQGIALDVDAGKMYWTNSGSNKIQRWNMSYGLGTRTATFPLKNGVAVKGSYAGFGEPDPNARNIEVYKTILSGNIGVLKYSSDNSYHVVTGSWTDPTAILDGFTITDGYAGEGGYPIDHGGGMFNSSGSPTIINCIFIANMTDWNGSGAGMFNYKSNPTVINCIFSGNECGHGGGGMANDEHSSPMLINCIFSGNSAGNHGGGMANWDFCNPKLTNCTFSGNQADNYGGAINNASSCHPVLSNCILWGNTATHGNEIALRWETWYGPSEVTVSYSDIAGGPNGVHVDPNCKLNCGDGNINLDPCFVDPNGPDGIAGTKDDNLRLLSGSPCIDAGDNNSVPADYADLDNDGNTAEPTPLDLDDFPRFIDDLCIADTGNGTPPIVDMGAYEFLRSDINHNGFVNFTDFALFALRWLETGCGECYGAELTCDGQVEWADLREFVEWWLEGAAP